MPCFNVQIFRRASKGATMVLAIFIAVIASIITVTMLGSSFSNTKQIVNDKDGKTAYYAATAGLEKVIHTYNTNFNAYWLEPKENLPLPGKASSATLANGSTYWVADLQYVDSGDAAMIEIVGKSKGSYRKIRARLESHIPYALNDFGLLTDGMLSISGDKYLKVSVHGNKGLSFSGTNYTFNNSTATQSTNKLAGTPDPEDYAVGGYIPPVKVPNIPLDYLRDYAKTGVILSSNDPNLQTKIDSTPKDVPIYIWGSVISQLPNNNIMLAGNMNYSAGAMLIPAYTYGGNNIQYVGKPSSAKGITLCGDQGGRLIFVDGDVVFNANGLSNLSNITLVSAGNMTVNGSVDIVSAHSGEIDTVFAAHGQINLNGSRTFTSLFWTDQSFKQSGSSIAGKVIAKGDLTFSGGFTILPSSEVFDNGHIEKEVSRASWQQIAMDE